MNIFYPTDGLMLMLPTRWTIISLRRRRRRDRLFLLGGIPITIPIPMLVELSDGSIFAQTVLCVLIIIRLPWRLIVRYVLLHSYELS